MTFSKAIQTENKATKSAPVEGTNSNQDQNDQDPKNKGLDKDGEVLDDQSPSSQVTSSTQTNPESQASSQSQASSNLSNNRAILNSRLSSENQTASLSQTESNQNVNMQVGVSTLSDTGEGNDQIIYEVLK